MKRIIAFLLAALLAGCVDLSGIEDKLGECNQRLDNLEERVTDLEGQIPGEVPEGPDDPGEETDVTDLPGRWVSIQEFGVLPGNTPAANKEAMQKAIDYASAQGLGLFVTPVENGYPMDGGLDLKRNVTLLGTHGPTGRGTVNSTHDGPTGSLFVITDREHPFIATRSATRIEGIQFYYPEQAWKSAEGIIKYPPTITLPSDEGAQGVTLRDLTFYGEWFAMDFRARSGCEQILFENCYGYPLSGQFIAIDRCWDIPRILHCHINPANMREFGRGFPPSIIDYAINQGTFAYWIDHTDNAVVMDIFTFGSHGGIYLGENTYGQLTNFNFDCVKVGIFRNGTIANNRTWQISQGSIIANAGTDVNAVHPIYVTGQGGHTSITNVECFSGGNGALTNCASSYDFICLDGSGFYTVALLGCRMSGYSANDPVTVRNRNAALRAVGCVDKDGQFFDRTIEPADDFPSGTTTVMDRCDSASGWKTDLGANVTLDTAGQREGRGCISATGSSGILLFSKKFDVPVNAAVSTRRGHFKMQLYISDINAIDLSKEGAIEVTSSGTCDKEEFAWYIDGNLNLSSGWNQIDLKLAGAGVTGGSPDLTRMDYIRIYHLGIKGNVTLKIDDIRFVQE